MKIYPNISGYLFFGIFWMLLFNTIGSTFGYVDSTSYTYSAHQENSSIQDYEGLRLVASDTGYPLEKSPYEVEEQKEEQEGHAYFLVNNPDNKDLPYSPQSISPLYKNFIFSTSQPKRYLLYLRLKIDC